MNYLSPRQIVAELDKYIIGQERAKKEVSVALRNRYRRSRLPLEVQDEITPKNIIMKGPTGVGKTEIARRLAKLVRAPFIKVEATKFTEVGYVGRDCESMIRDLVECSVRLVREEKMRDVSVRAEASAKKKVFRILYDAMRLEKGETAEEIFRSELERDFESGKHDNTLIDIDVVDAPKSMEIVPGSGTEINLGSIFGEIMPKKRKKKRVTVKEAVKIFAEEEGARLIDEDAVVSEGVRRAEQEGIIFIDEIDKIASKSKTGGADVSREGVQRDILPIVEGSTVVTKYGTVKTDYILFIAAGAFHIAAVEDLIPELQGRFPIRVELEPLTIENLQRILTEPENSLIRQYEALISTEGTTLTFTPEATQEIARLAHKMNSEMEDIGARRLHTMMEQLLEEISFSVSDMDTDSIEIDAEMVKQKLSGLVENRDIRRYLL